MRIHDLTSIKDPVSASQNSFPVYWPAQSIAMPISFIGLTKRQLRTGG
jgi:hypothetical protein